MSECRRVDGVQGWNRRPGNELWIPRSCKLAMTLSELCRRHQREKTFRMVSNRSLCDEIS
jgi:hypothetical protein